jgi:hydrogenase nickel incorporation protein HypA/HybF
MYELSVAQEVYCRSRASADEQGARELENVRVAIGELAGVDVHLLHSAWSFVTAESADENARLEIVKVPAHQVCPQCGAQPEKHNFPTYCERCKCHMRVESGDRVELLEIRFQQELAVV